MAIVEGGAPLATKDEETFEPQTVVAHLQVTRPDFDSESRIWRFRYGGKTVSVDISETDIADQVRARGYVRIGDTWRVKLLVTEKRTASGQYRNEYKVAEVLEFIRASRQVAFPFIANDDEDSEELSARIVRGSAFWYLGHSVPWPPHQGGLSATVQLRVATEAPNLKIRITNVQRVTQGRRRLRRTLIAQHAVIPCFTR